MYAFVYLTGRGEVCPIATEWEGDNPSVWRIVNQYIS